MTKVACDVVKPLADAQGAHTDYRGRLLRGLSYQRGSGQSPHDSEASQRRKCAGSRSFQGVGTGLRFGGVIEKSKGSRSNLCGSNRTGQKTSRRSEGQFSS